MKKFMAYRGLTASEYEKIKELAKQEIPFRVNIRIHKQKYAYGSIDIRPYGRDVYRWTKEEFEHVLKFVNKYGLFFNTANIKEENFYLCYNNGFTYTYIGLDENDKTVLELMEEEQNKITNIEENEVMEEVKEEAKEEVTEEATENQREFITEIKSNGSKWYGESPDTIDQLIDVLNKHALDPTFENYGNFINEYSPQQWTDSNKNLKGCISFFGNFYTLSHVFNIITNDPVVIDKLTKAIRANQATEAYKQAKIKINMDNKRVLMFN
jgi:hypothetical protein